MNTKIVELSELEYTILSDRDNFIVQNISTTNISVIVASTLPEPDRKGHFLYPSENFRVNSASIAGSYVYAKAINGSTATLAITDLESTSSIDLPPTGVVPGRYKRIKELEVDAEGRITYIDANPV